MHEAITGRHSCAEKCAHYWREDASLEAALDDLTLLATHLLHAPVAAICRWGGGEGERAVELPATRGADPALLATDPGLFEAALAASGPFVVGDTELDARFARSPLVAHGPRFRFCAAAPLRDGGNETFGALVVFDHAPRTLERSQEDALRALADEAARQLLVRHELGSLEHSLAEVQREDAALRATNAALHALIHASPLPIVVLNQAGEVRMWSARAEAMFGVGDEVGPGAGVGAAASLVVDAVVQAARDGRPQELRFRGSAGRWLDVKVSAAPLRDDAGSTSAFVGVVDDITQRKRAERRAAAELAATQVLAEVTSISEAVSRILQGICDNLRWQWGAFWRVDGEARVLRCVATHGQPSLDFRALTEETRGLSFAKGAGLLGAVWASGAPRFIADIAAEASLARRDGAIALGMRSMLCFPVVQRGQVLGVFELLSLELRQPDDALLAMFTNIGGQLGQFMERKRIEEERDLFFAVSLEMLCMLGLDGTLRRVNPAWQRTLGYSASELTSKPFLDLVHDADKERTRAELTRLRSGLDTKFFEHRVRAKDGTYRWLSWTCPGAQPGRSVLFAAVRDVTEIKHAEDALRHSEEQLRHAQKMEATGRLAGWTAHYFNNLLTAILGYSRLMLDRLGEDDPLRDYAKQIQNAGERTASLTQQLLAFSRRQALRPQVVDLNAIVADMDRMLRPLIGEDVELHTVLAPDLAPVRADRGQLEQVILNLVLNARDALEKGGHITVETAPREVHAEASARPIGGAPAPGRYAVLTVTDDGVGMEPELQSRVFEPFFTTKRLGQGTGLGLSMVYGIVQQTGGQIRLESVVGAGTRVEVLLPEATPAERPPATESTPRLLVVEDEESVRDLTCEVLRTDGFEVLTAADADEALRVARAQEGPIQVVITDVVLRGASGQELAREMASVRPEAKFLFMSGYASESLARYGVIADEVFLAKPFTPETLRRKVRALVERKTNAE